MAEVSSYALTDLPEALLELVLEKLEPRDLASLSRSSTYLQRLSRRPSFWNAHVASPGDILLSAAKQCLASILKLPPQVFQVTYQIAVSDKFPLKIPFNSAVAPTVPHVCSLLCNNDVEGVALEVATIFQERITKQAVRRIVETDIPLQPWDLFTNARADRGAVRLALSPSNTVQLLQRDIMKLGWRPSFREPVQLDYEALQRENPHLYYYFKTMVSRDASLCGKGLPDVIMRSKVWASLVRRLMRNQLQEPLNQQLSSDTANLMIVILADCYSRLSSLKYIALNGDLIDTMFELINFRELISRSLSRLQGLLPGSLKATEVLSWEALNGTSLAASASRADLRLVLGISRCRKEMYWLDMKPRGLGDGRLGDGKLRATLKLMGDHLKAHINTSLQQQALLPLVRSAVSTDVEKVAAKVEAFVAAVPAEPAAEQLQSASSKGGEEVRRALEELSSTSEGRQLLLRALLQLEWLRVLDHSLSCLNNLK